VEHFPKAPIQEALLDIQVVLPVEFAVSSLKSFGKGIEDRFPESQEYIQYVQNVQIVPTVDSKPAPPSQIIDGYVFVSKTNGKVTQARRAGFTFHKLKPYSRWEDFSSEAKELWQRYVDLVHPVSVKRLGLRYINRVELPSDIRDLREICTLFPDVPNGVPQTWMEYFQRFVSPREDGAIAAVSLALDNQPPPRKPSVILDIDVGYHLPIEKIDNTVFWTRFDALRAWKNEIFDASVTQKAKELFR